MISSEFRRALTQVYLADPCQVLPMPLNQMLAEIEGCETAVGSDSRGVNRLEAWTADSLYLYWRRDNRQPSPVISRRLEYQQRAIIHQDFLEAPVVAGFRHFSSYYRLQYSGAVVPEPELPAGFRFAGVVNSPDEVASIVGQIEQGGAHTLVPVRQWLESPSFIADLWLWVMDVSADQPAGIGVAELDPETREASILWVQVMPAYRRRGLGRAVVHELLRRVVERAAFVTVSGVVEDRDNPGAFFRQCGFTGKDIWWYLSRDQG